MSAKQARIIYKFVTLGSAISAVFGFICIWAAASTADGYALTRSSAVSDNLDMKILILGVFSCLVGAILHYIYVNVDFSVMYDIDSIPLYYTKGIKKESTRNARFNYQLERSLECFYNGIFGNLSVGDSIANKEAIGRGKGRVMGEYSTSEGNICIITNSDRTRTEVHFVKDYEYV